jgi:hypothetical protein
MTSIPFADIVPPKLYFLSDNPLAYLTTLTIEHREVATDRNRQTIAVTLHLHFAARVKNIF